MTHRHRRLSTQIDCWQVVVSSQIACLLHPWRYFGQVCPTDRRELQYMCFHSRVDGKRSRWRQQKMWTGLSSHPIGVKNLPPRKCYLTPNQAPSPSQRYVGHLIDASDGNATVGTDQGNNNIVISQFITCTSHTCKSQRRFSILFPTLWQSHGPKV